MQQPSRPFPERPPRRKAPFLAWGQDGFKKLAQLHHQVFQVSQKAEGLVKAHGQTVEDLLTFIRSQNTPVVVVQSTLLAVLCFIFLGWDPGFLIPSLRPRFRLLCSLLRRFGLLSQVDDLSHGVFLLTPSVLNLGFLSHQVHHWLAAQEQLPGYNDHALDLYRSFWQQDHGKVSGRNTDQMSLEELKSLRSAIQRDKEALGFLSKLMSEWIAPSHTKLDNGDTLV